MIVAAAVVIVVVFLLPLPHMSLFRHVVTPAKQPGATVTTRPPIGKLLAELKGSHTGTQDDFGTSVAVSGTTAIVGATGSKGGRAYVFTKTTAGWKKTGELISATVGGCFGTSVAISATTAVVGDACYAGDAGRAYVYDKTPVGWKQVTVLKGSDTVAGDKFGYPVAISGATIVIGAFEHAASAGGAYVFTSTTAGWKQTAELKGSDTVAGDEFGYSVAISGATVIVSSNNYALGTGRAYVFARTADGWKQDAELRGSDTRPYDQFGSSVAISGNTVVVGADEQDKGGRAYLFVKKTRGGWTQTAELRASKTVGGNYFGSSVAISGGVVVVGAPDGIGAVSASGTSPGKAYAFTRKAIGWRQVAELKALDGAGGDQFGSSVAVSGSTAVVGAANEANWSGRAYVFEA